MLLFFLLRDGPHKADHPKIQSAILRVDGIQSIRVEVRPLYPDNFDHLHMGSYDLH